MNLFCKYKATLIFLILNNGGMLLKHSNVEFFFIFQEALNSKITLLKTPPEKKNVLTLVESTR
jgi:hypothetical protein